MVHWGIVGCYRVYYMDGTYTQVALDPVQIGFQGTIFTISVPQRILFPGSELSTSIPGPCRCPMLVGGGIDHVLGCSRR